MLPVITDSIDQEPTVPVSRLAAQRLAESALDLAHRLASSQQALRRQAAELATRAAIIGGAHESAQLADDLQQTLADAAAASGGFAAAVYLLDDDTEYLTAHAVHGLPIDRLASPPRTLRGSRGDLEAMVQGVVAIDNLQATQIDTWNCPESSNGIAAALCAVIKSDDVPIGTLWIFADQPAEYGSAQIAATRLAASQLSMLISNAAKSRQGEMTKIPAVVAEIADWQCESLPTGTKLATDWRVDGMIESPQAWATGWHTWDVLPDGALMLAIAEAIDPSIKGAMTAAIARAAITSHLGYRHTPCQLLQRINDTLWHTNTCEQLLSLLYVRVDPETGEGEFAAAGEITAMIGSRYGYRPLVAGQSEPLGTDFRADFISNHFRMMPGETLLAYGPGMEPSNATQRMLGETLRTAMQKNDRNPLAMIRRKLAALPLQAERGAASLLREETGGGR
jgi:hypothetical protein